MHPPKPGVLLPGTALSGLNDNTLYYVWVKAVNSIGDSQVSEPVGARTVLSIPDNITVTAEGLNQLTVRWDAVPNALSYKVYYSTSQTLPGSTDKTGISGTSTIISNLASDTLYNIWVVVTSGTGDSGPSQSVNARTRLPVPPNIQVSAVGIGGLKITWDTLPNADNYKIYYSKTSTRPDTPFETVAAGTTVSNISNLDDDTPYNVWIMAVNNAGEGAVNQMYSGRTNAIFTITLMNEGDDFITTIPIVQGGTLGDVTFPASVSRNSSLPSNSDFLYWGMVRNSKTAYDPATVVTGNITMYAVWCRYLPYSPGSSPKTLWNSQYPLDGIYKLRGDVDYVMLHPFGNATNKFTGVLDGNGYTLSRVFYGVPILGDSAGIFGFTDGAHIKNITVKSHPGFSLSGTHVGYFSFLIGHAENTLIENVTIEGYYEYTYMSWPSGSVYVGGIVGYAKNSTIKNCSISGLLRAVPSPSMTFYAGKIVGKNDNSSVENCTSTGFTLQTN